MNTVYISNISVAAGYLALLVDYQQIGHAVERAQYTGVLSWQNPQERLFKETDCVHVNWLIGCLFVQRKTWLHPL